MIATVPTVPTTAARPAVVVRHPWLLAPIGFASGVVLGAVARLWMRWITDDPEFSWGGTIFIVTAFALLGMTQGIAAAARLGHRRRAVVTVARVFGVIGMMTIFAGAGAIMLPTVVGGGLAVYRTDWRRWLRVLFAVVALPPVVAVTVGIVDEIGIVRGVPQVVLFFAIYAIVIWAVRATLAPLRDGWRMNRIVRGGLIVVAVLLALFLVVSITGIGGG